MLSPEEVATVPGIESVYTTLSEGGRNSHVVYRCVHGTYGDVAAKVNRTRGPVSPDDTNHVSRLQVLDGPGIAAPVDAAVQDGYLIEVSRYVDADPVYEAVPLSPPPTDPGNRGWSTMTSPSDTAPYETVEPVVRGVLEALHQVHEQGWLHGDIVPENLLYDKREEDVTVIDLSNAHQPYVEETGNPLRYGAAPEKRFGGPVDTVTEVFEAGDLVAQVVHVWDGEKIRPREGTPQHVLDAVDTALEPGRSERFDSCAAFLDALQ